LNWRTIWPQREGIPPREEPSAEIERRMDLTSAKSPRGGALAAPESRVMTIKGATVNIN
jgi:hypothetical protein